MSTPKSVVTRDRNDTTKSDAVIINLLGAQRVSIGTMIEAGWADAARVPVILVIEPENIHQHMMLAEIAGYTVQTLDEAVHIVKTLFWRGA
jgi:nucleoside 2-deoxyribosyltransferase